MEDFIRYLEREASKVSVKKIGRKISWNEPLEDARKLKIPTEFIDIYYLGEKPSDVVIMDRGTAREIEERIKFLEEKLAREEEINDILKVIITFLSIILIIMLLWNYGV